MAPNLADFSARARTLSRRKVRAMRKAVVAAITFPTATAATPGPTPSTRPALIVSGMAGTRHTASAK